MRWLVPTLVALALFVGAFATVLPRAVVPCHGTLREEPEPPSWRGWPLTPAGAGYVFDGKLWHPRRPFYEEIHATAPGVCADGVLSLDQWLDAGPNMTRGAAMYHAPYQLALRQDPSGSGLFVVEGKENSTTEPVFVSAFRRDDSRWAYVSPRCRWLFGALAVGIVMLLGAALRALRCFYLGRLLCDRQRIRDGVRDAVGNIRLVDDGSSVVPSSPGPPGPVLVRIGASSPGSYREPPATQAMRIWSGPRESLVSSRKQAAARTLTLAVAMAAALAVGITVVAFVLDLRDAFESMS